MIKSVLIKWASKILQHYGIYQIEVADNIKLNGCQFKVSSISFTREIGRPNRAYIDLIEDQLK